MKKSLITVMLIFLVAAATSAQSKAGDESFGIKIKGFVKTDLIYDSRQTVSIREGHFFLYPAAEMLDVDGKDINDKANFNMLSIQTRVTGNITGPNFLGAKTSGVLEGAFFGNSNTDIGEFRLRHAFLKLDWSNSSLMIGQYWNPMFITEVFPGVVSFNTGVPFQPFSRNPQIRFIQKFDNMQLSLTAATQRDFTSTGPAGGSSVYLRNNVIPILDLNLKYVSKTLVAGASVNLKSLTPQIVTANGYKTEEKISSMAFMGFAKIVSNDFTFKAEGIYGENLTDLVMLGGYAVKSTDAVTGIEEYTNLKTLSVWTDLSYGKALQVGLFVGYTKNLGSDDIITGTYYSRGNNIASVMRISPRIQYSMGKTRFAAEIDYTTADYGTPNNMGEVENTSAVSNLRLLLAGYLFF
ncbi:hypothetical protein ACFLTH_11610 [Bacteroidota bacterium]